MICTEKTIIEQININSFFELTKPKESNKKKHKKFHHWKDIWFIYCRFNFCAMCIVRFVWRKSLNIPLVFVFSHLRQSNLYVTISILAYLTASICAFIIVTQRLITKHIFRQNDFVHIDNSMNTKRDNSSTLNIQIVYVSKEVKKTIC